MNKLFSIIAFVLMALLCVAQNNESTLDVYIAKANAQCPISFSDGWTVESFTASTDTVTMTITLAGQAAGYLPMMAAYAPMVKIMWLGQMSIYGERWNQLVELVVAEDKTLAVLLRSQDKASDLTFVFTTEELKKK